MFSRKKIIALLVIITIMIIVLSLLFHPIPQAQSYHHFADERNGWGIINSENVLSNILFLLVGGWGLLILFSSGKVCFVNKTERWPWIAFSIGLILTAIGSSYYHLAPDNARLFWDRLPMTMVFMSFLAAIIQDRINFRFGFYLWPFLLFIGFYSVFYWYMSELQGGGDLRFYLTLQIYVVIIAIISLLLPSHYTRSYDIAIAVALYVLSKLFEIFDHQIYKLDHGIISGHTLKHVIAAMAGLWLLRMIRKRKIVAQKQKINFYMDEQDAQDKK